ncbi:hypothetical protein OPQ81_001993 [Rhizoctonia solani]|nr:hypothetical protein OPQ81_001993 [Rhizoctonia solani]
MPIGQLLASITGEAPASPSTTTATRPINGTPAKRKADADTKGAAVKAPRTVPTSTATTGPSKPNGEPSKTSRPAERPTTGYTGSARPSSNTGPKSFADRPASSTASKKPSLAQNGRPSPTSTSFSGSARSTPAAASSLSKRPVAAASGQPASSDTPAKVPKKGSIAEIKARAAAQQQKLQAIGKIQHKATERVPTKKEREEAAAEELRAAKKGLRPGTKSGAAGPLGKNGTNGMQRSSNGHLDRSRGAVQKPVTGKVGKAAMVEERKPKKAAVTTGYLGSARPPPSKAKPGAARPGVSGSGLARDRDRESGRRPNPMGMFSKPRRQRDEDYDEDMDDFVVDDEEEEDDGYGYGSRYRYAEDDDDSDMEAGYSDVEDEEAAAARLARLEDAREEALLEKRKREKEARKRAALQNRR